MGTVNRDHSTINYNREGRLAETFWQRNRLRQNFFFLYLRAMSGGPTEHSWAWSLTQEPQLKPIISSSGSSWRVCLVLFSSLWYFFFLLFSFPRFLPLGLPTVTSTGISLYAHPTDWQREERRNLNLIEAMPLIIKKNEDFIFICKIQHSANITEKKPKPTNQKPKPHKAFLHVLGSFGNRPCTRQLPQYRL